MIYFKSDPITFPCLDNSVILIISDNILQAKKELNLQWTEEDMNALGQAVFSPTIINDAGIIYCIVPENCSRLTLLHEAMHCMNFIYSEIDATISAEDDEVYVRHVSWLQEQILGLWDYYFEKQIQDVKNSCN